jgi:hypothetical protein
MPGEKGIVIFHVSTAQMFVRYGRGDKKLADHLEKTVVRITAAIRLKVLEQSLKLGVNFVTVLQPDSIRS